MEGTSGSEEGKNFQLEAGGVTKSSTTPNGATSDNSSKPPATITTTAATTNNPSSFTTAVTTTKSTYSLDDANEELAQLIISGRISSNDVHATKSILKEHVTLKEKVEKLKSLLGRSAKAQREAKIDSDASQKRLTQAMKEIDRLNQKLDKLQTRPSHLDLLMDFETNFDKALLSVGQQHQHQQSGGQDTSATPDNHNQGDSGGGSGPRNGSSSLSDFDSNTNLDSMLLQELGEARSRIDKLETLNNAMMQRSTQLEHNCKKLQKERDDTYDSNSRLQMQLRMAQLEAEQSQRAMLDKVASLEEMQLEIDCLTKTSFKNNVRAAKGEEVVNSLKSEKQYIAQLESQIQALQEWAMASAESKQLMSERCRILETKLKQQQKLIKGTQCSTSNFGENDDVGDDEQNSEQVLFKKNGSMVIGAGDTGHAIISLGEHAPTVDTRFVTIRWKFDCSPPDLTIDFSIMKGICETSSEQAKADYLIKDRVITGGAGGETEGAFNTDGACTFLWSNTKSWIRPRAVKYSVEVISLK